MKRIVIMALLMVMLGNVVHVNADSKKNNTLYVTETSIQVWFQYGTKQMILTFSKCGINSLMGLSRVSTKDDIGKTTILASTTDWIGPFIVRANNNGNKNKPAFTGGWHGYNGDGTGTATAITIKYEVYADGKKVDKKDYNKTLHCNEIRIWVVNSVQGYNTKQANGKGRYILQEQVNYKFDRFFVSISTEFKALEDLTIEKYYGLQTQNTTWRDSVEYVGYDHEGREVNTEFNGYERSTSSENAYKYILRSKEHMLIALMNTKLGLGTRKYVTEDKPSAFTETYGKSYFNLVNGVEANMKKNDFLNWFGVYIFRPASEESTS